MGIVILPVDVGQLLAAGILPGIIVGVACGISGVSMGSIAKQLLPFIAVEVFCALLFSFVSALSTFLPSLLL